MRTAARLIERIPIYPVLFAAAFVLGAFGDTFAPADWLWRPLAIAVGGIAAIQLAALILMRRPHVAAAVAGSVLCLLLGLGRLWLLAILLLGLVVLARRLFEDRLKLPKVPPPRSWTRVLNVVAVLWLGISVANAIPAYLVEPTEFASPIQLDPASSTARPDIYVLWLDGYARADTLRNWGFDNEPFLTALEERGFAVRRDAEGSYPQTFQTLASLVQMTQVPDLPIAIPETSTQQHRLLRALINDAPALDELRKLGYTIATSPSQSAIASLESADVNLDGGYPTEFELSLLERTEVDRVVAWVAPRLLHEQHAARVRSNFGHLRQLARRPEPVFALIHVMNPHMPFVFDEAGSLPPIPACFPNDCKLGGTGRAAQYGMTEDEYAGRYTDQVAYLNTLVLDAVDDLIKDPEAVVVLLSDHGSRYSAEDSDEWYRTLFASRTPAAPDALVGAPISAGIMVGIFNAYFGTEAAMPPAGKWRYPGNLGLSLERVDR